MIVVRPSPPLVWNRLILPRRHHTYYSGDIFVRHVAFNESVYQVHLGSVLVGRGDDAGEMKRIGCSTRSVDGRNFGPERLWWVGGVERGRSDSLCHLLIERYWVLGRVVVRGDWDVIGRQNEGFRRRSPWTKRREYVVECRSCAGVDATQFSTFVLDD